MIPQVKELYKTEVRDLLDAFDKRTTEGLRAQAVLAVLLETGIRRGELCKLLVEDFTDGPLPALRVKTAKQRNGKEPFRSVPLLPQTAMAIHKYLKRQGHGSDPTSPLFLTLRAYGGRRKAITITATHRLLLKGLDRAGIVRRIRCHTFRHHFATQTHEHGAPVATVSQLLGHASSRSTDSYLHASEARKRQAVTAAFGGK